MTLANRPEGFLSASDPHNWSPSGDYHVMRVALRLGIVNLAPDMSEGNIARSWVNEVEEYGIRSQIYWAAQNLIFQTGKSMSFIDEKMWQARGYCPEMEAPDCSKCLFTSVCKKRVDLFQPIIRTTAY